MQTVDGVPVPDRPLPPASADEAPTEMKGKGAVAPTDDFPSGAPGRMGWLFAAIGVAVGLTIVLLLRYAR